MFGLGNSPERKAPAYQKLDRLVESAKVLPDIRFSLRFVRRSVVDRPERGELHAGQPARVVRERNPNSLFRRGFVRSDDGAHQLVGFRRFFPSQFPSQLVELAD